MTTAERVGDWKDRFTCTFRVGAEPRWCEWRPSVPVRIKCITFEEKLVAHGYANGPNTSLTRAEGWPFEAMNIGPSGFSFGDTVVPPHGVISLCLALPDAGAADHDVEVVFHTQADQSDDQPGHRIGDWIWSHTGKRIYPFDPRREDFCHIATIHALAGENRFGCHTRDYYSVAEHSVRVASLVQILAKEMGRPQVYVRKVTFAGLWHDGAEGCGFKDMPSPIKNDPCMAGYRAAEKRYQSCLYDWLGVGDERMDPIIKQADRILCATEQRNLMLPIPPEFLSEKERPKPLAELIVPWGPLIAELRMLAAHEQLSRPL